MGVPTDLTQSPCYCYSEHTPQTNLAGVFYCVSSMPRLDPARDQREMPILAALFLGGQWIHGVHPVFQDRPTLLMTEGIRGLVTSQSFFVRHPITMRWWLVSALVTRPVKGWHPCGLYEYRQFSNISRIQSQNINVSRLVFQLSLPNPLKPDVKLRMKM